MAQGSPSAGLFGAGAPTLHLSAPGRGPSFSSALPGPFLCLVQPGLWSAPPVRDLPPSWPPCPFRPHSLGCPPCLPTRIVCVPAIGLTRPQSLSGGCFFYCVSLALAELQGKPGHPTLLLLFLVFFLFLFFCSCTRSMWKSPGQGLSQSCWPVPQPQPHKIRAGSLTY